MLVDVLPRWERCVYWTVEVLGLAYIIYSMFCEEESKRLLSSAGEKGVLMMSGGDIGSRIAGRWCMVLFP